MATFASRTACFAASFVFVQKLLGITEIKLAVTQDGVTRYRKRGHDWPAALVDDYHLPLSPVSDICVKSAQSVDDRRARQGTLPGYGVEWVSGLGSGRRGDLV